MKKYYFFIAVAILIIAVKGQTQSPTYLVKTNLSSIEKLYSSSIQFSIYHYIGDDAIIETDDTGLNVLFRYNKNYKVLDIYQQDNEYYLVSTRFKDRKLYKEDAIIINNRLDYNIEQDWTIIKCNKDEYRKLYDAGYKLIKINDFPLPVRFTNSTIQSFSLSPNLPIIDPQITNLVSKVDTTNLKRIIQDLQNFETRYTYSDKCDSAGKYLFNEFTKIGLPTYYHYYPISAYTKKNVIGTITGSRNPDKKIIIGGHYDAINNYGDSFISAPGADDNASGTAGVVELARIFSTANLPITMVFATFSGEEQGLVGSGYFASYTYSNKWNVECMLNMDMIGNIGSSGIASDLIFPKYSSILADLFIAEASVYSPTMSILKSQGDFAFSDHWYFQQNGYKVLYTAEKDFSPYYHSSSDVINHLSFPLIKEILKVNTAILAVISLYPSAPDTVFVIDGGTGDKLKLEWNSIGTDIAGYKIYYDTIPNSYKNVVDVPNDTSYIFTNLNQGSTYYFYVTSYNLDGKESWNASFTSGTSNVIPSPPKNLIANPKYKSIELVWDKNQELDIKGYNVYRRTEIDSIYVKQNTSLILTESYKDTSVVGGVYYYYVISAVDSSYNESGYSDVVWSKPITLDRGILVVDETKDGTTATSIPPIDLLQDAFYDSLLSGYNYAVWDCKSQGIPTLIDLGEYSTIIWHDNDPSEHYLNANANIISQYLKAGGNLFLTGWKSTTIGINNKTFSEGSIQRDMFHIKFASFQPSLPDFAGAEGEAGFTTILPDTAKILDSWYNRLRYIERIIPDEKATVIYRFNSASGDTAYNMKPCGIKYYGDGYKVAIVTFPLYYMDYNQSKTLLQKVLSDFGESISTVSHNRKEINNQSQNFALYQNYPNPFNPETVIQYAITGDRGQGTRDNFLVPRHFSLVTLKVYNITGQLVKTLVDKEQPAGYYSVKWDGKDDNNKSVPSGVYIYRLSIDNNFTKTKYMVLLK